MVRRTELQSLVASERDLAVQVSVSAAKSIVRSKGTYLAAHYRQLVARRGKKRAIVAVSHTILVILYHLLMDGTEYKDFHGGFGVNIVGHAHPKIVEALEKAAREAIHFAVTTPTTVALAEAICERFELEQVRMRPGATVMERGAAVDAFQRSGFGP